MKKLFQIIGIGIITMISVSPLNGAKRNYTHKTITLSVARDGTTPFSEKTSGFALVALYNLVLKPIVTINDKYLVKNNLLNVHWDYHNIDQNSYTIEIPDGLKFQNGREVEGSDIDFSFQRFFLRRKSTGIMFLSGIKGIDNLKYGEKYVPNSVPGIKVVNKKNVVIFLSKPNPSFLYSLQMTWISIVPKEELEDDYFTWKKWPIGAGDYKITSIDPQNRVTVEYIGKTDLPINKPSKIIFDSTPESLQTADVIMYSNVRPKNKKYELKKSEIEEGSLNLYFNYRNKIANNLNFRKAIASAVNREGLIDKNNIYTISKSMVTEDLFDSSEFYRKPSLDEAKKYIEKIHDEVDYKNINISIGPKEEELGEFDRELLDRIKTNLFEIGIKVNYVFSDHLVFNEKDDDITMKYDYRGNSNQDPLVYFRSYVDANLMPKYFPIDKPTKDAYSEMVNRASNTNFTDVKNQYTRKFEEFFYDNVIAVPLFQWKKFYWVNTDIIQDIKTIKAGSIDPSLIELK